MDCLASSPSDLCTCSQSPKNPSQRVCMHCSISREHVSISHHHVSMELFCPCGHNLADRLSVCAELDYFNALACPDILGLPDIWLLQHSLGMFNLRNDASDQNLEDSARDLYDLLHDSFTAPEICLPNTQSDIWIKWCIGQWGQAQCLDGIYARTSMKYLQKLQPECPSYSW